MFCYLAPFYKGSILGRPSLLTFIFMTEYTFTDANFHTDVLNSDVPVLVDFWAPWCGPCKIAGPIIEKVAESFAGKAVKIGKLNVDENPITGQQFGILSIPTLLIFKGGKVVDQTIGVPSEAGLTEKINSYLS